MIEVDENLSFLDSFTQNALARGSKPYCKPSVSSFSTDSHLDSHRYGSEKLHFDAYERPQANQSPIFSAPPAELSHHNPYATAAPSAPVVVEPAALFGSGSTGGKWGPKGYNDPVQKSSQYETAATPATVSASPSPYAPTPLPAVSSFLGSPSPSISTPAPKKKEFVPKELSEKEKAAMAMFAGIGSVPASGSSGFTMPVARKPSATTVPSRPAPAAPAAAQAPSKPVVVDILGDAFSSGPAPVASTSVTSGGSSSPPPAKAPASIFDLDAMFSSPAAPQAVAAPVVTSQPQPVQVTKPAAADIFDIFSSSPAIPTVSATPVVSVNIGVANASSAIKQRIAACTSSPEQFLFSGSSLSLSAVKLIESSATTLVLCVSNKANLAIQNVSLSINVPDSSGLSCNTKVEPGAAVSPSSQSFVVSIAQLPAGSTQSIIYELQCKNSAVSDVKSISGTVSCASAGVNSGWQLAISLQDFIRPAALNAQQFGGGWKQYAQEVKFRIASSSVRASIDFTNALRSQLHFHLVQTIGLENIMAGTLVSVKRMF